MTEVPCFALKVAQQSEHWHIGIHLAGSCHQAEKGIVELSKFGSEGQNAYGHEIHLAD